jgi:WS/DGAT/MGAT family acyltransferase
MTATPPRSAEAGRQMRPFDAWLFRGEGQLRTRATVMAACVLARAPASGRLVEVFERVSRVVPRLRQRVVAPAVPLFLPSWIVDPDFDLDAHLSFEQVGPGASLDVLLDVVREQMASRLDPLRPLWQATLLQGFRGGRAALLLKLSHAITDGIGAQRLFAQVFSDSARAPREPMPPLPVPEDVTADELLADAVAAVPLAATRAAIGAGRNLAAGASRWLAHPLASAGAIRDYAASVNRLLGQQGRPAPGLAARGPERFCAVLDLPLAALRRAARAADASVNDAYLGAVSAVMRRYLVKVGAPAPSLPLAMPVNLRRGDEPAEGNHFGGIALALPLEPSDPRERIAQIRTRVREGRAEPAIGLPFLVAPLMARLPQDLLDDLSRRTPAPDVQASNVAGSPRPQYVAGVRIESFWAFGPVPGIAAMFTMHSLAGRCYVAINGDAAAIRDPVLFGSCLRAGFEEVLRLGGGRPARLRPAHVSHGASA